MRSTLRGVFAVAALWAFGSGAIAQGPTVSEVHVCVPDQAALAVMTSEERRQSFVHQPVGPRAAIVVAGPLANFLLAIAIFAGLFMIFGKPSMNRRHSS